MTTTDLTSLTDARITALAEIADPLERAKAASALERVAAAQATGYARERARAIKAAVDAGTSQAAIANELGISRGAINKILVRLGAQEQARP